MIKGGKIFIGAAVLAVLGGTIVFFITQKPRFIPLITSGEEGTNKEYKTPKEIFSFAGTVSSVDLKNSLLVVASSGENAELRLSVSATTRLIKLELPFDPQNPPQTPVFTPKQVEVKLSDFKPGNYVFVKVRDNISGKTEFGNIDFIHILP